MSENEKHWLFCWNPKNWTWSNLPEDAAKTLRGEPHQCRWSCQNRQVQIGDSAWLIRLGQPPKGMIGRGRVTSAPYEAPHYDEERATKGDTTWYVDLELEHLTPSADSCVITMDELESVTVDSQTWSPQSSGIELKHLSAGVIDKLWNSRLGSEVQTKVNTLTPMEQAKNLILYGPPGTGKTYKLLNLQNKYISTDGQPESEWLSERVGKLPWHAVLALSLADAGGSGKVPKLREHRFLAAKAQAVGRISGIDQTLWSTLSTGTSPTSITVKQQQRYEPFIFDKTADSTWQLQPNWKDDLPDLVGLLAELQTGPPKNGIKVKRYEMVTFHQSYGYEDFVEGIRPVQDDEKGELVYRVQPGIFRRICKRAFNDPSHRYALFIDEINRANIAKVLGELITLLETDKRVRLNPDGSIAGGVEVTLPYSQDKFGVPANLDIYGTMNTADRSISLLDTALRRRFTFEELMPNSLLIKGSRGDGYIEDGEGGVINLRKLLETINKRIAALLNREMTLGHAYLMNCTNFVELNTVIRDSWLPLLQEYFYDDWQRIRMVFADNNADLKNQIVLSEETDSNELFPGSENIMEQILSFKVSASISPDAVRKIYEAP